MNESSRKKLQVLLNSLQAEADPVAAKLEEYNKEIFRLTQEVEKLTSEFSEDEFVFSPRISRGQNDEIREKKIELDLLKIDYKALMEHYNQINENIDTIVEVLSSDNGNTAHLDNLSYQEQDRQRIARDLHQTALSELALLVDKLEDCTKCMDTDPIRAKMELSMAKKNLKESIDNIRSIIYDLRPVIIDASCFKSVLERLIRNFNDDGKYQIEYDIEDVVCNNQMVITTIYRVIEECLMNIKKHAEAYKVSLIFQEQIGYYYLYVEDDGKGFDLYHDFVSDYKFGLSMMKERVNMMGGTITVNTAVNAGTKIKILIPMA